MDHCTLVPASSLPAPLFRTQISLGNSLGEPATSHEAILARRTTSLLIWMLSTWFTWMPPLPASASEVDTTIAPIAAAASFSMFIRVSPVSTTRLDRLSNWPPRPVEQHVHRGDAPSWPVFCRLRRADVAANDRAYREARLNRL